MQYVPFLSSAARRMQLPTREWHGDEASPCHFQVRCSVRWPHFSIEGTYRSEPAGPLCGQPPVRLESTLWDREETVYS